MTISKWLFVGLSFIGIWAGVYITERSLPYRGYYVVQDIRSAKGVSALTPHDTRWVHVGYFEIEIMGAPAGSPCRYFERFESAQKVDNKILFRDLVVSTTGNCEGLLYRPGPYTKNYVDVQLRSRDIFLDLEIGDDTIYKLKPINSKEFESQRSVPAHKID